METVYNNPCGPNKWLGHLSKQQNTHIICVPVKTQMHNSLVQCTQKNFVKIKEIKIIISLHEVKNIKQWCPRVPLMNGYPFLCSKFFITIMHTGFPSSEQVFRYLSGPQNDLSC